MYAIVKFTDENTTRIVHTTDIKHFDPKLMEKQKFLVKFEEDGNFYPAQVVMVKDTIEELERSQSKRLRFINKNLLDSAASETSEDELHFSKKATHSKTLLSSAKNDTFKKKKEAEIFNKYDQGYDMEKKNKSIKTTKDLLNKASEGLECEVSSEVSFQDEIFNNQGYDMEKKNKPIKKTTKDLVNEASEGLEFDVSCKNCKILEKKLENMNLQYEELYSLNKDLQKEVISHFKDKVTEEDKVVDVGGLVKDQVHLGRGVFMPKTCFNDAWFRSISGAQFVKTIAFYLFGHQVLVNSSVTGKSSNKYKKDNKKPPLDPTKLAAIEDIYKFYLSQKDPDNKNIKNEIKMIKTYICSKISDLTRSDERRRKRNQEREPDNKENEAQDTGSDAAEYEED